jgi:hypothetical protein
MRVAHSCDYYLKLDEKNKETQIRVI